MALAVEKLLETMVSAAEGAFSASWKEVQAYTTPELEKIAATVVSIEANVTAGSYTQATANLILRMQVRSAEAIVVSTTGLLLLDVEEAIAKVMAAIAGIVNGAVGFSLVAV